MREAIDTSVRFLRNLTKYSSMFAVFICTYRCFPLRMFFIFGVMIKCVPVTFRGVLVIDLLQIMTKFLY